MVNCGTEFPPALPSELNLASMSNAKIQQAFRSATQNVTTVLKSNEIHEENIATVKDSLTEWVNICKEAVQADVPLDWEEDPIVGWESTLASLPWLPPKFLKQFKAYFSWFMANADVTVSSSRTTSEATDLSKESREVEFESAGKTPPRKRSKTGDHSATRARDEDWEPATPVKRSARNRTPKAGWGESAKKKKREQPVFDPEKHSWNKMKCTHCAQRVRAPERPCFSFKSGPKRCARCVFDNARCHPSNSEETGGLEAADPQEAAPEAGTPTPMTPAMVRTGDTALDTPTPSSSNLSSTLPPNTASTLTAQSLNASLWSSGSASSLAATPSPFVFLPGLPRVGQLLNIGHQHQSPFSAMGLDIAAEIQALYARVRWMQENAQEMMKRIQELEALLIKIASV